MMLKRESEASYTTFRHARRRKSGDFCSLSNLQIHKRTQEKFLPQLVSDTNNSDVRLLRNSHSRDWILQRLDSWRITINNFKKAFKLPIDDYCTASFRLSIRAKDGIRMYSHQRICRTTTGASQNSVLYSRLLKN